MRGGWREGREEGERKGRGEGEGRKRGERGEGEEKGKGKERKYETNKQASHILVSCGFLMYILLKDFRKL